MSSSPSPSFLAGHHGGGCRMRGLPVGLEGTSERGEPWGPVQRAAGQSVTLVMINSAWASRDAGHGALTCLLQTGPCRRPQVFPGTLRMKQILSSASRDLRECPLVCFSLSSSLCIPASPASLHSHSRRSLVPSWPPLLAPWVLAALPATSRPPNLVNCTSPGFLRWQFCPG